MVLKVIAVSHSGGRSRGSYNLHERKYDSSFIVYSPSVSVRFNNHTVCNFAAQEPHHPVSTEPHRSPFQNGSQQSQPPPRPSTGAPPHHLLARLQRRKDGSAADHYRPIRQQPQLSPGILLTCKEVHKEAIKPFYAAAAFHFNISFYTVLWMQSIPQEYLKLVTSITYHMKVSEFVSTEGWEVTEQQQSYWLQREASRAGVLLEDGVVHVERVLWE